MDRLVRVVVESGEKAGELARIMRRHGSFQALVEEKGEKEKNPKFKHDFKTLADVLVQQAIKREISTQFPALAQSIFGEESAVFTTVEGKQVDLTLSEHPQTTKEALSLVLTGKGSEETISSILHCIYSQLKSPFKFQSESASSKMKDLEVVEDLGVWIDPIDGTNEYVLGRGECEPLSGVYPAGLQTVTVLIGVFDVKTKQPVLGVINQPFWEQVAPGEWQGRYVWGVCWNGVQVSESTTGLPNTSEDDCSSCLVVVSPSVSKDIHSRFSSATGGEAAEFHLVKAAGAGYKLLCVVDGLVAVYVDARGTSYSWDTCGPHAILLALGGGITPFHSPLRDSASVVLQLEYGVKMADSPSERYCNKNGLLAYRSCTALDDLLKVLAS